MTHKISLTPEEMTVLGFKDDEPVPKVLPLKMRQAIHKQVAKAAYGPLMKPPFKTHLMYHGSVGTILASWASDRFMQRAWKYMRARMSA